jgi:hypothetical protein
MSALSHPPNKRPWSRSPASPVLPLGAALRNQNRLKPSRRNPETAGPKTARPKTARTRLPNGEVLVEEGSGETRKYE